MKSARDACAAVALTAIVGCAFGCSNDDPDLTAVAGAGGGEASTLSGTGDAGESGPIVRRECRATCTAAADCAMAGDVLFDEDNFACTAGMCEYEGCNSTQECTDSYRRPGHACETIPGSSLKACFRTCATAADCATAGDVLFDEDNFACTAGMCEYKGCNSTQECKGSALILSLIPSPVCATSLHTTLTGCVATCTVAADCAHPGTPLFGENNYACTAGMCEYKGCNSTQECTDAYQSPSFVCE